MFRSPTFLDFFKLVARPWGLSICATFCVFPSQTVTARWWQWCCWAEGEINAVPRMMASNRPYHMEQKCRHMIDRAPVYDPSRVLLASCELAAVVLLHAGRDASRQP